MNKTMLTGILLSLSVGLDAFAGTPDVLFAQTSMSAVTSGTKLTNFTDSKVRLGDSARFASLSGVAKYVSGLRPETLVRGAKEAELYRLHSSSVVLIATFDSQGQPSGIGSGIIISKKGDIVTNWHVVKGHDFVVVAVKPPKGEPPQDVYVAEVIRTDPRPDLALIRLHEPPGELNPATIGSSAQVEIGDDVHAIGHPTGEYWTYTTGIVSQYHKNRKWGDSQGDGAHRATVIQTQTPINPGNSGGPLLDDSGEIVGINTFTIGDAQNISHAVAAEDIRAFLEDTPEQSAVHSVAGNPKGTDDGVAEAYDRNKDGKADAWVYDTNSNGKPDFVVLDNDHDGIGETVVIDNDENGVTDVEGHDTNGNGVFDKFYIDHDQDGKFDIEAEDVDEDGEIDRVGSIS